MAPSTSHAPRRPRRPWIVIACVAILAIFGPGFLALARLSWRQHLMDRRLTELETSHRELTAKHQRLQSDPTYVEDLIRSTFKVAKPGEVVVPLDAESAPADAADTR